MKLLFKQRLFSWFDSYDIFDENQKTLYTVQGKLSWGHKLEIYDPQELHLASLQQQIFTLLPRFDILMNGQTIGTITKKFSMLRPAFSLDCNGWQVEGNFWEWSYRIVSSSGETIAQIEKQLWNFTDTYIIDVAREDDALLSLLVVLAIDAVKCSGDN